MTIYKNLNNIFELESVDTTQIILKVNANSSLKVAKYPFVSSDYDYITVTRGRKHLLTVIHKDGTTFSFHWGEGGYTLISDNLSLLKYNVITFIEDNCGIILEYDGTEPLTEATIYYNTWYKKWQLSLNRSHWWSNTATDSDEMIEECKKFVTADEWKEQKATTGITVWKAINPKFTIR